MAGETSSRVAVLMPAYNAGACINQAVQSLVDGRYPCDVYIVDDGSSVPVATILKAFPRTHVIRLERNGGLAPALNAGLEVILSGPYEFVARLDADDIAHPDRILRQVEFFDRHPETAAVGTWGRHFAEGSGEMLCINRTPANPVLVRKAMRYNSAIIHTSAMIRTSVLRAVGLYSESYPAAEDYELFRRISKDFAIANIPSVLVDICISPEGVSLRRRRRQLYDRLRIQWKYLEPLKIGAWLGMAKTVALFFAPTLLLSKIKSLNERRYNNATGLPLDEKRV